MEISENKRFAFQTY